RSTRTYLRTISARSSTFSARGPALADVRGTPSGPHHFRSCKTLRGGHPRPEPHCMERSHEAPFLKPSPQTLQTAHTDEAYRSFRDPEGLCHLVVGDGRCSEEEHMD